MAIKNRRLKFTFDGGLVNGQMKKVYKTYTSINAGADDLALQTAASALAGLQGKDLVEVTKIDESVVI